MDLKLLAVIPARGGSKGIPKKNIKPLAGKPLIGWSIDAAKRASCVDRIIVSTEDEQIASAARDLGADVPFVRPAELATDEASSIDVVLHAIEQLPGYDWVLLLQPTSPLRSYIDIDSIWQLCNDLNAASAVSVCQTDSHPYWMYHCDSANRVSPIIEERPDVTRRQDLPPVYSLNGALYLARVDWLLEQQNLIGQDTVGYIMPLERSVDLDSPYDWRWVEFLVKSDQFGLHT